MSIIEVKTEVSIRYDTIAEMQWHGRTIMSPFRKYANNLVVYNDGKANERVDVQFIEQNSIMVIDWNQLAFAFQGPRENSLLKDNGKLRYLFDAYERLNSLDTFSETKVITVHNQGIINNDSFSPDKFAETTLIANDIFSDNINEISIITEGVLDSNTTYNLNIGTYLPTKDISQFNMYIFGKNAPLFNFHEYSGYFFSLTIEHHTNKFSLGSVKTADNIINSFYHKFNNLFK